MQELIIGLSLAVVVLIGASLLKTYKSVPLKEQRRRARKKDKFAEACYKVSNYGQSADILLWAVIGTASAWLFIRLSRELETWLALLIVVALVWLAFWWIPGRQVSAISRRLAIICSPVLAKILSILMPPLKWLEIQMQRFMPVTIHTGLYEKEDLVEFLDAQINQADNRLSEQELTIAKNALQFGDKKVRDVMTPKRMMKTLMADDTISPHLLDEIHATGFSRLPVYELDEESKEKVVGILYTKDLIEAVHAGSIGGVMDKKVYYVQEELDLSHVLSAFLKTKHHLFVVVNNFEEIVGVISIEDILEQIIGRQIVDEFDAYEDLRAVAGLEAQKDRKSNDHAHQQPETEQTD